MSNKIEELHAVFQEIVDLQAEANQFASAFVNDEEKKRGSDSFYEEELERYKRHRSDDLDDIQAFQRLSNNNGDDFTLSADILPTPTIETTKKHRRDELKSSREHGRHSKTTLYATKKSPMSSRTTAPFSTPQDLSLVGGSTTPTSPSLVSLCVGVIEKNWERYDFNFTRVPTVLKIKILMCLIEKHPFPLTEHDLILLFGDQSARESTLKEEVRKFFEISQMKKLPGEVKDKKCRINTLTKYILPKLVELYGGKENLLQQDLLQLPFVQRIIEQQVAKKVGGVIGGQMGQLGEHHLLQGGVVGPRGTIVGVNGEKIEVDPLSGNEIPKVPHLRTIPKHLENHIVVGSVIEMVKQQGGGEAVQKKRLWSSIARDVAKAVQIQFPEASKTLMQNHANYFVKEIYIKSSIVFEQIANIKDLVDSLGGIHKLVEEDRWRPIADALHFDQPDAVWLVQQTCKHAYRDYTPSKRASRRS